MDWTDITEQFRLSVSKLSLGEMVSSPIFRLEDAMSSIELMEPRMDPCYDSKNKEVKLEMTRESLLSRAFSEIGQIRVVDMLIGLVYNWLSGNLYIQTVHSTIFMIEREKLPDASLRHACREIFDLSCDLREMMMATGVCDEEDFIGFMFGLNEDGKLHVANPSVSPEVLHSNSLKLRFEFITILRQIILQPTSLDMASRLIELENLIVDILEDIETSIISIDSIESELIDASIDSTVHRDLMPPGPPRRVASMKSSQEVYKDWQSIFESIKDGLNVLSMNHSEDCLVSPDFSLSFCSLFNALGKLRRFSNFRFSFLRTILYHRVYYGLEISKMVDHWVSVCYSGRSTGNISLFKSDLCGVIHKVVFTLFRSASRQHRRLKHVLTEVSVMQHRAWELCQKGDEKQLWSFVALIGTYLVELNLVLSLELNLVDLRSEATDVRLVYFLLESVTGVKLYLVNDLSNQLQKLSSTKQTLALLLDLRSEILVSAVEHYLVKSMGQIVCKTPLSELTGCARLFELRSAPIRFFPLPTSIGLEDFHKWSSASGEGSAEECLLWIDRIFKTGANGDRMDGPLIASDLAGIKRTLLSNKITLMKHSGTMRMQTNNKYHCFAISLVAP